jgi:hypothetical protein
MGAVKVRRLRKVGNRYFWNPSKSMKARGFKSVALGADLGLAIKQATDLNAKADASQKKFVANLGPLPGSMGALVRLYEASSEFADKAEKTKSGYRPWLREIEKVASHVRVVDIARPALKKLYRDTLPRGPRAAKALIQMYSILLTFAADEGWIRPEAHPARMLKMQTGARRRVYWTVHQLNAFLAKGLEMGGAHAGVARIAMIAYAAATRLVDARNVPWSALGADGVLRFTPNKTRNTTGINLEIEMPGWLLDQMATWPRLSPVMVVDPSTGEPFKEMRLSKLAREIRVAAKLPSTLQMRDLRRTALTEAGEGGATVTDLKAMSGHVTTEMLSIYVVPTGAGASAAQAARGKPRDTKR